MRHTALIQRITACGARHQIERWRGADHYEIQMMPKINLRAFIGGDMQKAASVHRRRFVWDGETETHWTGEPIHLFREKL